MVLPRAVLPYVLRSHAAVAGRISLIGSQQQPPDALPIAIGPASRCGPLALAAPVRVSFDIFSRRLPFCLDPLESLAPAVESRAPVRVSFDLFSRRLAATTTEQWDPLLLSRVGRCGKEEDGEEEEEEGTPLVETAAVRTAVASLRLSFKGLTVVGAGATAVVFSGVSRLDGATSALKIVPTKAARKDGGIPALEATLAAAAPLHLNVVRFRSSWSTGSHCEDEEALVLQFELCGPSLEEWMRHMKHHQRGGHLGSQARRLRIFSGVAAGLAALHSAGIAHRDVKPGNVVFDEVAGEGGVGGIGVGAAAKLCDLGHGCLLDKRGLLEAGSSSAAAGVGTVTYAAPEQVSGERALDNLPASDVFSLGILLAELLAEPTGFQTGMERAVVLSALRESGRLPAYATKGDQGVRRLTERCCAREPAARPSAAEVARESSALAVLLA